MWWTDNAVQPETLFRMQHHQKINHFPGERLQLLRYVHSGSQKFAWQGTYENEKAVSIILQLLSIDMAPTLRVFLVQALLREQAKRQK